MRRGAAFSLVVLALLSSASAQSPINSFTKFVGTWTGTFQDRPLVKVNLAVREGKLTGTFSHAADIKVDDSGDISEAAAQMSETQVVGGFATGDTLRLTCREPSGEEMHYELTISGNMAELKLLDAPPEYNLKPWKLVRAAGKS
jgi:hypothetical protein